MRFRAASGPGMPRDLRLLSAAGALSAAGDTLLVVVLALRVHDLTGSGFAVAGSAEASLVPATVPEDRLAGATRPSWPPWPRAACRSRWSARTPRC